MRQVDEETRRVEKNSFRERDIIEGTISQNWWNWKQSRNFKHRAHTGENNDKSLSEKDPRWLTFNWRFW